MIQDCLGFASNERISLTKYDDCSYSYSTVATSISSQKQYVDKPVKKEKPPVKRKHSTKKKLPVKEETPTASQLECYLSTPLSNNDLSTLISTKIKVSSTVCTVTSTQSTLSTTVDTPDDTSSFLHIHNLTLPSNKIQESIVIMIAMFLKMLIMSQF